MDKNDLGSSSGIWYDQVAMGLWVKSMETRMAVAERKSWREEKLLLSNLMAAYKK
jgi:hypothetical protein